MKIKLIRHATLILSTRGINILVDPMLDKKGVRCPIPSKKIRKNPTIELPLSDEELMKTLNDVNAVLITHTHSDHFDEAATRLLPKDIPVLCQPEDQEKLINSGFKKVYPIKDEYVWNGIRFIRKGGQHGKGDTALKMAPVSGFIIKSPEEPSVYIAGDTIWCNDVEKAIESGNPEVVVVNAGGAQFLIGEPITMTPDDVRNVCIKASDAKIVAVHMEAINHCLVKRNDLKEYLEKEGLSSRVLIPMDGEELVFI